MPRTVATSPTKPAEGTGRLRLVWIAFGWAALGLGVVGIVLPLLPTTPLVLLAAACFGRGSPRLRTWLIEHPRLGPSIHDWERHRAIPRRAKRAAIIAMAGCIALSIGLGLSTLAISIQAVCLSGAALFILTRPEPPTRDRS